MNNITHHAGARCQQRGIPPFILDCLDHFGEEVYDGHGAIIRYFTRVSRRKMERELGRDLVSKLAQYLDIYKVVNHDNDLITAGHRNKRINHK
jgi:predicted SnoaL-like aldol condensation-catalyzing enzyme